MFDPTHTAMLSMIYVKDDLPARAGALLQNARDAGVTII